MKLCDKCEEDCKLIMSIMEMQSVRCIKTGTLINPINEKFRLN